MRDFRKGLLVLLGGSAVAATGAGILYLLIANFHIPRYRGTMIGIVQYVNPVMAKSDPRVVAYVALPDGSEGTATFPAVTAGFREGDAVCVSVSSGWFGPVLDARPVDPKECAAPNAAPP